MCEIYSYEIKKIEQQIAESLNKRNIHEALDIPDFRHVKNSKLLPEVIKSAIKKLKISEKSDDKNIDYIKIDDKKYKLVTFSSGELPKIKSNNENLIFFMYQPGFKKIFYCGKLLKENISSTNNVELFTDFGSLEI
ncbi:MAG: hypothetical protein CL661_09895 [Bacteroidetes bacterium]|nr:hypothetical protein [Bacteroidota bacterium]|tara:strand:- start:1562 stop:1969 length:408 start_codon:yes stop_codon:yes gene_type:complete